MPVWQVWPVRCRAAGQQSSRAAEQQSSRAAGQQDSRAAEQQGVLRHIGVIPLPPIAPFTGSNRDVAICGLRSTDPHRHDAFRDRHADGGRETRPLDETLADSGRETRPLAASSGGPRVRGSAGQGVRGSGDQGSQDQESQDQESQDQESRDQESRDQGSQD